MFIELSSALLSQEVSGLVEEKHMNKQQCNISANKRYEPREADTTLGQGGHPRQSECHMPCPKGEGGPGTSEKQCVTEWGRLRDESGVVWVTFGGMDFISH